MVNLGKHDRKATASGLRRDLVAWPDRTDFAKPRTLSFWRFRLVCNRLGRFSAICRVTSCVLLLAVVVGFVCDCVHAAQLWLKDGRLLEGKLGLVSSLAEAPTPIAPDGSGPLQLIAFIDDGLRRTFISKRQIQDFRPEDLSEIQERFRIPQPVVRGGQAIKAVGTPLAVEPFDEYGRRIIVMNLGNRPTPVIQCITEITPSWAKVESRTYVWDMRIATTSIPLPTLEKILAWRTDQKDLEARKSVVRFYIQAEYYEQALKELEKILEDFADQPGLADELQPTIRRIRQLSAQRILNELKLRQAAGQHRLVQQLLRQFPSKDVAGNILEQVREMLNQYAEWDAQCARIPAELKKLQGEVTDSNLRGKVQAICDEIANEINYNNLSRLAPFWQILSDETLSADEKLAIAISGWLLGGGSTTTKLPLAVSMYEVRRLLQEYFLADTKVELEGLYEAIRQQEAGTPRIVSQILAQMKPPWPIPQDAQVFADIAPRADQNQTGPAKRVPLPGFYRIRASSPSCANFEYYVQLPPEYDPYRKYPAIVTLHGESKTAVQQIEFWAGEWTPNGTRYGQATRHGYIVISPEWAAAHQTHYLYTPEEHAVVLASLRDAIRRFSIDTDRVFLTGHSMGGDAAWDIGLSHPDLWAGVIPFVAKSDKYCHLYWENAAALPMYFVCGELDDELMKINAQNFDRYLSRGFPATVVEFLGRGHEFFFEEIHRLFDWMGRYWRDFWRREIEYRSMRLTDNFCYWLEFEGMPPATVADPTSWPLPRGKRPMITTGKITEGNAVYVTCGGTVVHVWLSPELLDFDSRISVTINSQRINPADIVYVPFGGTDDTDKVSNPFSDPDIHLQTILEDARTRGDRQHVFWVHLRYPR